MRLPLLREGRELVVESDLLPSASRMATSWIGAAGLHVRERAKRTPSLGAGQTGVLVKGLEGAAAKQTGLAANDVIVNVGFWLADAVTPQHASMATPTVLSLGKLLTHPHVLALSHFSVLRSGQLLQVDQQREQPLLRAIDAVLDYGDADEHGPVGN